MTTYDSVWAIVLISILNLPKVVFGTLCFFYPNYPLFDPVMATHCPDVCCSGYIRNASNVCCTATSNTTSYWWIFFPIVGLLFILIVFIINRICLKIKLKNRIRNSNQPMFGNRRGSYPPGVFQMNPANNYYGRVVENLAIYDVQNTLPSYNDLFGTQTISVVNKQPSASVTIPKPNEVTIHRGENLDVNETTRY